MKIVRAAATKEVALMRAYAYLEAQLQAAEKVNATEQVVSTPEQQELYTLVTDHTTRARVLLIPAEAADTYILAKFAPGEWGNYTLPYKNIPETRVFMLLKYSDLICFLKPPTELPLDEAGTLQFETRLNDFFGTTSYRSAEEYADDVNKLAALRLFVFAPVRILSELTGLSISNAEDYAAATAQYFGMPTMPTELAQAAEEAYHEERSTLFLKWVLYEFMRVERYDHLQECLTQYRRFGLSGSWAASCKFLRGMEPERFIIANYLGRDYCGLRSSDDRMLSAETGIPLRTLIKARKIHVWGI